MNKDLSAAQEAAEKDFEEFKAFKKEEISNEIGKELKHTFVLDSFRLLWRLVKMLLRIATGLVAIYYGALMFGNTVPSTYPGLHVTLWTVGVVLLIFGAGIVLSTLARIEKIVGLG